MAGRYDDVIVPVGLYFGLEPMLDRGFGFFPPYAIIEPKIEHLPLTTFDLAFGTRLIPLPCVCGQPLPTASARECRDCLEQALAKERSLPTVDLLVKNIRP
jgi:hypothetical protein